MNLVIVESPTKAKTLKRFLGAKYTIEASMGHVRDLPKSKLGVDTDHNFEPVYEMSQGKSKVVSKLKKLAKEAQEIYLATDPDREGEAIAFHLKELISGKLKKKFKRVTFHEITKPAIEAAVKNPGELNLALVDAQQARRVVDRLVGYKLSPVLWKKIRRGLSAGRVQSVAVKLIVQREKEITAFKPLEYWEIKVKTETNKKESFWVELFEIGDKKIAIKNQEPNTKKQTSSNNQLTNSKQSQEQIFVDSQAAVEPIVEDLKKAKYAVEKVERKERLSRPYPPYTTSTLQQAAANVLGWSGKMTMSIAQDLYEAGLITYHRTDSLSLAAVAIEGARTQIKEAYGPDYLPEKPNFYKTNSKNAQEAHEAIRPTEMKKESLAEEKNGFSERHDKLYKLIWRRMIACQMKPAVYDATTILVVAITNNQITRNKQYKLRATGSITKFDGWRKIYGKTVNPSVGANDDSPLPNVIDGDPLKYLDLTSEQKFTQPPPRFNDASLVKELEKLGIGRPSTYAPIISTVIARGYIERVEKRFNSTAVGITVTEFLDENFKEIMDYGFTAEMEEDLDRISRGEKDWRKVMAVFYKPFAKQVATVEKNAKRTAIPVEETGEMCPECKTGKLVIRTGRFGKFISCGRFPECKYTARLVQKLEGFLCPQCGGEVVMKRTKKGRSFWGCANYPKCDYASWKDPRQNTK